MEFALGIFPADEAIAPAELGRAAEAAGFESLWFPEHTHIPASLESRPNLQPHYWRVNDPLVALATVASATTTLKLGTGVILVPEHDPILLAKQVATLDHLSGGRFLFGVGGGWNVEEMRNHGADPRRRFALMRDRVQAMKEIWTSDEATYEGEFVRFERILSWPKPVQKPYPPILMGGNGPKATDRVLDYADEWIPNMKDLETLGPRVAELRERAGRHVPVTYFGAGPDDVPTIAEAGVDRCILMLPPRGADEVLPLVEQYASRFL
jgi:probable F420-dependent oxidoreductase